jgi:excisionase family DNA binding protein
VDYRSPLKRLEACEYLKISASTLDRRRKAGVIPVIPLGGRVVRIDPDVLDAFRRAGYPSAAMAASAGGDGA